MPLLVSDSSVLIDLERGGLLEAAFTSGFTMVIPDLLFENELRASNGVYLVELGLTVIELGPDEVAMAQDFQSARSALSLEDCFALCCAIRPNHILLAGDGPLRKEAGTRGIPFRGLLWLLDEMFASGNASKNLLCEGITKIFQHARCRLPKAEVERRKKLWCDSN